MIAGLDEIARLNEIFFIVPVYRKQTVTLNRYQVSIAAQAIIAVDDLASVGRINRRAFRGADIYSFVKIRPALAKFG